MIKKTKLNILPNNYKLVALVMLIGSLLCTALLQAGLYRWVDENGVVHFGDRIPAKYAKIEREVYSSQGLVIDVLPAEKTKEQLVAEELQRQLSLEQERLAKLEALRNKTLLASYNTVKDIERTRDEKLARTLSQIELLNLNLDNLRQQKESLARRTTMVENGSSPDKEDILARFNSQKADNEIAVKDLITKREALEAETYKITAHFAKEAADFTLLKLQREAKKESNL